MFIDIVTELLFYPRGPMSNLSIIIMRFNRVVHESANRRGVQKTYIQFVGNVEVCVKPVALIVEKEALHVGVISNVVDAFGVDRDQLRAPLFIRHLVTLTLYHTVIETES